MNNQNGLSLIEVMVALVISTILILGVTDLFNNAYRSGNSNSELARVQESGRLALEVIGADARLAGLWSCASENWEDAPLSNAVVRSADGKSITFKYVDIADCATATIGDRDAKVKSITYKFDNGLKKQESGGVTQAVIDGVDGRFDLVPKNALPDQANAVVVTINTVTGNGSAFSDRIFSATYEFKNKMIKASKP